MKAESRAGYLDQVICELCCACREVDRLFLRVLTIVCSMK